MTTTKQQTDDLRELLGSEAPSGKSKDEFEFDFAGGGDLDAGWQDCTVKGFENAVSQAGNPQFVWQLHFDESGRILTMYTPFSLVWKVTESLRAVGIRPPEGDGGKTSIAKFSRADVIGKKCKALIVMEEYEGAPSPKVKKIAPRSSTAASKSQVIPD